MPIIKPIRNSSVSLRNFFEKAPTEGDLTNFLGSSAGNRLAVRPNDTLLTNSRLTVAPILEEGDSDQGDYLFTLPFSYVVGAQQLVVLQRREFYIDINDESKGTAFGWPLMIQRERILEVTNANPDSDVWPHYEESSSTTVRVRSINDNDPLIFMVPQTAITPESREKITVRDQGDNRAIELLGNNDGILMRSPNGSRFLVRVDDSGNLVTDPR